MIPSFKLLRKSLTPPPEKECRQADSFWMQSLEIEITTFLTDHGGTDWLREPKRQGGSKIA